MLKSLGAQIKEVSVNRIDYAIDIGAVMIGGRFESGTIGKMPGRQVIVYDKLKEAKDLKTPYWFDVWGIDPSDPGTQVWRDEIRGGKVALDKAISKAQRRTYTTIEAVLPKFLSKATDNIRYVTDRAEVPNVTRSTVHPLWVSAPAAIEALPAREEPALPQAYVLEQMRMERVTMAIAQGFGDLNILLVLEGYSPEKIRALM